MRFILTMLCTLFCVVQLSSAKEATKLLKAKSDLMLKIVGQDKTEQTIKEELRKEMDTFFDYDKFSRLTMKKYWDGWNEEQRNRFSDLYRQMVQNSYLKKFKPKEAFSVEFKEETTLDEVTIVKALITYKESTADVEYLLHKVSDEWLVYDVVIDTSSLMRTYRKRFNKVIKKHNYDKLIEKMQKSVDKYKKTAKEKKEKVEN